jgi:dolichol-phosphate mannosyltransferase
MLLTIIIPVYNEKNNIQKILDKIFLIKLIKKEIIIVDDCSTDGTRKILKQNLKHKVKRVIFHKKNHGKGAAINSAKKFISGDLVLIQDADLEYDPNDYYKLLKPFKKKNVKCVYGSRFLPSSKCTGPKSFGFKIRVIANYLLTLLSNLLNNQNLTDAHTCYKVFSANLFRSIELEEKGFDFCPEITAKISKKKIKIHEVPISYVSRTYKEGKKIKFIDGFKAIRTILYYNFLR